MRVERTPGSANLVEVLDRVLDKGVVIDAWVRVSLVGIDLLTVEARVVVASIATYLQYSQDIAQRGTASGAVAGSANGREEGGGERRTAWPGVTLSWDGARFNR